MKLAWIKMIGTGTLYFVAQPDVKEVSTLVSNLLQLSQV